MRSRAHSAHAHAPIGQLAVQLDLLTICGVLWQFMAFYGTASASALDAVCTDVHYSKSTSNLTKARVRGERKG